MIDSRFMVESPEAVGIDPEKLAALLARARREVDEGLLPAVQVAVARHGRIGGLASFGAADDDTLFHVFSCTKAVTSAAAWLLLQEGRLDERERVVDIVEPFATNGKEVVTVGQLLTHTAGFPTAPFRPLEWNDPARREARFRQWRLNFEPGSAFQYHPTASMWVVAEIIERRSGIPFARFVRERVALPLGLPDLWLGCPPEQHHRIADVTCTGEPLSVEDYRRLGLPEPEVGEVTEAALTRFNEAAMREVPVPGGGAVTGAAELALFYQALLDGGARAAGAPVWRRETLADVLRVRTGDLKDPMTGVAVNRALGVVIAGDERRHLRGFGRGNSERAFGHGGAGGQIAWGDPVSGISLGYCTSGHDRNPLRVGRRSAALSNRAAELAL